VLLPSPPTPSRLASLTPSPILPPSCAPGEWFPVHAYTLEAAILGAASPQAALLAASGRGRNNACEACLFYDYGSAATASGTGTANSSLADAAPILSATCAAYSDACRGETLTVLNADSSLDFNAQVDIFLSSHPLSP
jgi:hypothetical protein